MAATGRIILASVSAFMLLILLIFASVVIAGASIAHAESSAIGLKVEPDRIERRFGLPPQTGRITLMDDEGLVIREADGASTTVRWDRVREVHQERPDPRLESWLAQGERMWRARIRLERGDVVMAEPLLRELFEQTRGQSHAGARLVAEGLLRCRLVRGDQAGAVLPALEVIRLHRAGIESDAYRALPAVLDEKHELVPALPPVWQAAAGDLALVSELEQYDAQGDAVVAQLALRYRQIAARQAGHVIDAPPARSNAANSAQHPGLQLVQLLVDAHDGDSTRREESRQAIRQQMEEADGWVEAWLRFHLGSSLLEEEGVGRKQRGLVALIHLPARFSGLQPYLAGLALDRAREGAEKLNMNELADRLRVELERNWSNHPIRRTTERGRTRIGSAH